MARRRPRTRAQELEAHVTIAKAAAELCFALTAIEPQVADFGVARTIILNGIASLEQELKSAESPASSTEGASKS